jgi:hypothetical protein
LFIALVSLVRGGYPYWFSKTITDLGERGEEDYYEANQKTFSWGYNQITVHKWTMINAFIQHITVTSLSVTTDEGTN